MAAPATTARVTPVGIKLEEGHSIQIAFALDPDISFWEVTVQPPGVDNGDAIDTTTQFNVRWRSKAPQALIELTEVPVTGNYDPVVYNQIIALIGQRGSITVHFPDGSTLDFFGYLRSWQPQPAAAGADPEFNAVIQPTNWDPINHVEAAPVMTEVTGT